jgi:hypothetical protein
MPEMRSFELTPMSPAPFAFLERTLSISGEEMVLTICVESPSDTSESRRIAITS